MHVAQRLISSLGIVLVFVSLIAIMGLVVYDDHHQPGYSHQDYRTDVMWCVDHGYLPQSNKVDTPVTCTYGGGEVAIPPRSVNPHRDH